MRESEVRDRLKVLIAAEQEPLVTDEELEVVLRAARISARPAVSAHDVTVAAALPDDYATFRPEIDYALGDIVVPEVRNGHYYVVSVAGTASEEPVWPVTTAGTVVSGTVTFAEAGAADWPGEWDIFRAAAEGWMVKAGKVASNYKFTAAGGGEVNRADIFERCMRMSAIYAGKAKRPPPAVPSATASVVL